MISDYSVPSACQPSGTAESVKRPRYLRGRWTAGELGALVAYLDDSGREALAELSAEELYWAWSTAIQALLDARSSIRRALEEALRVTCRLSGPALQAGLEAMLEGTLGQAARELLARADRLERRHHGLVVAVLAANVPALAVQVLLPTLALRRPLLLKSSSREPLLTPALVHLLGRGHPTLARGLAAVAWQGGDSGLEGAIFDMAESVVAFGSDATLAELGKRREDVVGHGSMFSLAIVSEDADLETAAAGLARDIALFEQRGCLSVQAILTDADGGALAKALATELEALAVGWPPPEPEIEIAAAVRQIREEASLRGLPLQALPLGTATVILESEPRLRPVPGLRSVRVHPLGDLDRVEAMLTGHRDRIQGVALAGARADQLRPLLADLGVTRIAPPGELQRPDALWANGETHLIERLA